MLTPVEYLKKAEERVEDARKLETEHELLRVHNEKLQDQQRQMVEENDAIINVSNGLKGRVAELEKELDSLKQSSIQQEKFVEQLKTDLKKKGKIILEYDEKFEQLEERMQDAAGRQRNTQTKASTMDEQLSKLQKEMDSLRKENESLLLAKEKEASATSQERLELRKAIDILEKNLSHLSKEKAELEHRASAERFRPDRIPRKFLHKEVQTDRSHHVVVPSVDSKTPRALQQPRTAATEDPASVQKYAEALKGELEAVRAKFAAGNAKIEELERKLSERGKQEGTVQDEFRRIQSENVDLKKRREAATQEINKLTQQLIRRGSRLGEGTPSSAMAKEVKDGKVIRHMSEAVISTRDSKGARAMTGEQEIILGAKKELEMLYKDFIRCVFHDNGAGTIHLLTPVRQG